MANSDQNGIDRLSSLPEHILLHILSFLPTETAVATTVLSKSWQFLWTLVPNLDFDYYRRHQTTVVPSYANFESRGIYGYQKYKTFANFVTRVFLHRREKFIRRFRLSCHQSYDPSDLDLWVSYAMPQNVQELDLDLGCNQYKNFRFHCTQQSCKILESLKLTWSVPILDDVSFPVLKILHLKMPKFESRDIEFLPSGFPVLEELVIYGPVIDTNFEIYLPKLRSLAITLFGNCGLVRIDCPALTYLLVGGRKSREFHLENLLSLVEAEIEITRHRTLLRDYNYTMTKVRVHEDESYGEYVMNVIKAISNVRTLSLSLPTMNEIEYGSYSFFRGDGIPVFHNLVDVELLHRGCTCEIIILMLQKFENLKCLTVIYEETGGREKYAKKLIQTDGRGVDMKELIQTNIPNCLTSHLTTFCYIDFKGKGEEMKITRYILRNALVLKKMEILFSSSLSVEDGGRIQRKLCKSPRSSEGCELEFDHFQSSGSDSDSNYNRSSDSEDLDTDDEYFRSSDYDNRDCDDLLSSDSDSEYFQSSDNNSTNQCVFGSNQ